VPRLVVLGPLLCLLAIAQPAAAGYTEADRRAAVQCDGVPGSPLPPVLLIPGTGVNAEQNWSWGYATALRDQGHAVCTVDPPERSTIDVQDSVLFVRTAIEEVAGRDSRRMSLIGHSQGAFHAVHVLRLFPELAPLVDDVVGLAGLYERGSDAIRAGCTSTCTSPFWQVSTGSRYMAALARRPLPAGPSYSAIGTLRDTVVTPQPQVNALAGGRSIQIQDVCPGRQFADGTDHIYLAADAVAYALARDALDNAGTADPARVSPLTCAEQVFRGADLVKLAILGPGLLSALVGGDGGAQVTAEPPLRCPLADGCGLVLRTARLVRATSRVGRPILVRVNGAGAARVRLRVTGPRNGVTPSVGARAGRRTVAIAARTCRGTGRNRHCTALPAGRYRVVVQVLERGAGWVDVAAARMRLRAAQRSTSTRAPRPQPGSTNP